MAKNHFSFLEHASNQLGRSFVAQFTQGRGTADFMEVGEAGVEERSVQQHVPGFDLHVYLDRSSALGRHVWLPAVVLQALDDLAAVNGWYIRAKHPAFALAQLAESHVEPDVGLGL